METDLVYVASFEGGHRFQAGDYPVIVLKGTYWEMGRQYGGLMKKELNEEYSFLLASMEKRGYTKEQVRAMERDASAMYPERLKEVFRGMSETTGLSYDDIIALYNGGIIYLMVPPAPASCSYLAAWGDYTTDGTVIASRNWDLPDAILPFNAWNVVAIYRPSDGSNAVATVGPAGMRPETLMNSKGLFIADDNSGIADLDVADSNRPDLVTEFFRFMLDYSELESLKMGLQGTAPDVPWIVDVAGPENAMVLEMMTNKTRVHSGDGVVAAANHFTDPAWGLPEAPAHSSSRYNGLLKLAGEAKGSINPEKMMAIRDVRFENGGATFYHSGLGGSPYSTIHQVVFVPATKTLWLKTTEEAWQRVELRPLFGAE
ncbi:MAG: peptidase M1 [Methanomicrobiales archaeon]|nr:peptidase M1 [Methanomicrobiales archaeon]